MNEMQRDFYLKSEVDDKFGGMIIEKISKADFDDLTEKDPNTIYYVYDDAGNVTQYVGDAALSGGGGLVRGTTTVLMMAGQTQSGEIISGNATIIEE